LVRRKKTKKGFIPPKYHLKIEADVLECLKALKNMTVADLGEIKHELIQLKPKWLDFLSSGYPSIYWEIVDAIIYDTYPLIIEQQIKKIFGEEE